MSNHLASVKRIALEEYTDLLEDSTNVEPTISLGGVWIHNVSHPTAGRLFLIDGGSVNQMGVIEITS